MKNKKFKILFITFAPHKSFQAQIGALSAFLKDEGHEVYHVEIIVFTGDSFNKFQKDVEDAVMHFSPDFVAFSSYDMNYYFIVECARFIKKFRPAVKIIVGGHHASMAPEDYLSLPYFDFLCLGDGEYVFRDLLNSFDIPQKIHSISGLVYIDEKGQIVRNLPREPIANLNSLPFVDRTIDMSIVSNRLLGDYLPMLVGRGCPFNCTYCANESMRNLYVNKRNYVRKRDPEIVIEEIKHCKKVYKFSFIVFLDDIFTFDVAWLEKFCYLYKQHFPDLPFHCLLRPELALDTAKLKMLYDAGCRNVKIGVESGSENYRRRVLKRMTANKVILKAAKLIKQNKLELHIFLMVGLPEETFLDMLKTLWLNLRIGADAVQTAIFYPFKNTPLYFYCKDRKLLDEEKRKKVVVYTFDTTLNYPWFKRILVIAFKWINSSVPIFRRFKLIYIPLYLRTQFKKLKKKSIDFNW